ncbi:amino acid ABC transporter permease [Phaeospirillum tilakii]|uniref:Amino acid ABC transporter permease n=1 Tax=Phaeospirillum tilakii TaxID=741673 RepID=A0ABW5C8K3_9PROT
MERPPAPRWWNDARGRALFYQAALLAGLGGLAWFLIANTLANLEARHIATGFAFLGQEAAFGIGEHLIPYSAADSYLRAFVVGLLNTLEVSALGILFCTLLGGLIGAARLSPNPLVRALAGGYVEAVRNVPLLLQLLLWYALITEGLPAPRQALALFDSVFLSNRGLKLPVPLWAGATPALCLAVAAAALAVMALAWAARRIRARSGRQLPTFRLAAALLIGLPLAAFLAAGAELPLERPRLAGFNFTGGVTLTPEFAALLFGLTVYTAAFVAEIVRGGILAVPPGQTEAALALGLSRGRVLRLVVLPQALRVVVPPLTSQYLNLTKNSTLAVAIGYPDLVSVGNTAINQTGQAVEGVAILMAVYLTLSLGLSLAMNRFNARVALRGGRP